MLKSWQEVLEYAFTVLNNVYYDNELPPIVITLQSSPRSNGHFTVGKVWRAEQTHLNEINISVEHLDRPIENVMATLQHEMVHYYCQLKSIADVSQNGRYHNKLFKQEAEKRGLLISYEKYIGYSRTQPSQEFIDVIRSHGIEKPLDINRDGVQFYITGIGGGVTGTDGTDGGLAVVPKKPKCSTRKYQCPSCQNSFRATKDIRVLCLDCMAEFQKVEK
ncbi:MAG: SprT-like domain-containing protein [Roseburia sp.]|nr:SprT-like domain-containing protein [Roseburia sp.]